MVNPCSFNVGSGRHVFGCNCFVFLLIGDKSVMSPAHIGQVPTPIPMVSSPHTPQPVISTVNTTSTNPNTPVSTVSAGPNTPTPTVSSPGTGIDGSTHLNDGNKKSDDLPSEEFPLIGQTQDGNGDPNEDVCDFLTIFCQ